VGEPQPSNFALAETEVADPADGELIVRNTFMSVDPYMRGRMNDVRSYVPPYALGATITGGAIGRVVASASDAVPVGAVVLHQHGWTDVVQADAATFRVVPDVPGVPLSLRLHVLGMTGLTAYVGLTAIAGLKSGGGTALKKARTDIQGGDTDKDTLATTFSVIDKAAKRGLIKGNTADRYKSRLASRLKASA